MSEKVFKCPKCGNTENFTAYELRIYGPIDVSGYEWEPRWGHGLHLELPEDTEMVCDECGHRDLLPIFWDDEEE